MQADFGTIAKREPRRTADWWFFGATLALVMVGLMAINSVDQATGQHNAAKQGMFAALGIGVWFVFRKIPLSLWQWAANGLYVLNLGLLSSVLLFGHVVKGAKRWILVGSFQFQPSDLTMILVVLTLAAFFARRTEETGSWKTYGLSFLHVLPSVFLLLLQPHYGRAACVLAIWLVMALYAGVPWKTIGASIACLLALVGFALFTPGLFKGYHMDRISELFNKVVHGTSDTQGTGWQAAQSVKAISMGGLVGTGYGRGEQKAGRFIPEQHNDFVFSVIGEELGLIGSLLVLAVFLTFFFRMWYLGYNTRDPMRRLVTGGLLAFLSFHTVVNLSMVLNIGPVIGLWLPFVSNGGTALMTCMAAVGLADQPN
ncbi:MAG: rod shape-determining protein RodA [Armatimonadetes bacterium]|nr:rod shape-determining protein RodA [Armatimonadota bacterium]